MRVCPECGHHDPWYWRGSGVYVGLEFCRFVDFKEDYPELAEALLKAKQKFSAKNFVFDKDYCYHLTKGMNVERQSLVENPPHFEKSGHWRIPVEASPDKTRASFGVNPLHHGKKITIYDPTDPFQKKLVNEKQGERG